MNKRIFIKIFLTVSLLFLSSCREYFITTKVNSDGTVERTIVVKDDNDTKKEIAESWLKSSGWDISASIDSAGSKKTIKAVRKYPSYSEINENSAKPKNGFHPVLNVEVDKQFRFFFTYYSYKEIYKPFYVFNKTPLNKFFPEDVFNKIKEGTDTTFIKMKLDEFEKVTMITAFFDFAADELYQTDKIKLHDLINSEKKKELISDIWNAIELKDTRKKDEESKAKKSDAPWVNLAKAEYDNNNGEKKAIRKYFDENVASKLDKLIDKFPAFEEKLKAMAAYDGNYENSVILPGIITSSNSKKIEGNKVSWNFDQNKFKFIDYEMIAESREVNTWVIIASSVIIILLAIGLIIPRIRRKNSF